MNKVIEISSSNLNNPQIELFLSLKDTFYGNNFYYYSERSSEKIILDHYASRSDYKFSLLLLLDEKDCPLGRLVIGINDYWSWAFFGMFECIDDKDSFKLLMTRAIDVAKNFGKRELKGPINFNGLNNWQFLLTSEDDVRWTGDPYHHKYYPNLFVDDSWRPADQSISFVLDERKQQQYLDSYHAIEKQMLQSGFRFLTRTDFSDEEWIKKIWELSNDNFSLELNAVVKVPFDFFNKIISPLFFFEQDPYSIVGYLKDDTLIGMLFSHLNFIESLCNSDRKKNPPPAFKNKPIQFASKTAVVKAKFRKEHIGSAMVIKMAHYVQKKYGHNLIGRRTSIFNEGTKSIQKDSKVTHTYGTFSKSF